MPFIWRTNPKAPTSPPIKPRSDLSPSSFSRSCSHPMRVIYSVCHPSLRQQGPLVDPHAGVCPTKSPSHLPQAPTTISANQTSLVPLAANLRSNRPPFSTSLSLSASTRLRSLKPPISRLHSHATYIVYIRLGLNSFVHYIYTYKKDLHS